MVPTLKSILILADEWARQTSQDFDIVVKHVMDDAAAGYFEQHRQVIPVWGGEKGDADTAPARRPVPDPQGNAWWLGSGEDDKGLRPKGIPRSPIRNSPRGKRPVNFPSIADAYDGSVVDAKRLAEHLYMPGDVFAEWFEAKRGRSDDVGLADDTPGPESRPRGPNTPRLVQPAGVTDDAKGPRKRNEDADERSGSTTTPTSVISAATKGRGRKPGSGSFEHADSPLIEEMKGLVGGVKGMSPWAAAHLVAEKADGAGTPESKAKRLYQRFQSN